MTTNMAWIVLVIAGVLEFIWAAGLKQSEGFSKLWPSVFTIAVMAVSFYLLSLSMKVLPIGVSYTVWTGIGAVGSVVVGYFFFHESMSVMKLLCLALIVGGILGLKFAEG
ncbi:DMT family transporter [Bdellovibrio sp. HCB337]|uniref:DMT family transporter n=1 Tax=Bdellovibrio sp. HCB337 TaxID=3394358 RepID=UPI0039A51E70